MNAIKSPRLRTLAQHLKGGRPDALRAFWEERRGNGPLVEPDPKSKMYRLVTFVWRGNAKTTCVGMHGGRPIRAFPKPLEKFGDTDLWFRTERLPADARLVYFFFVNAPPLPEDPGQEAKWDKRHKPKRDPLNKHRAKPGSVLVLPGAAPLRWLTPHVPQRQLERHSLKSTHLKQTRRVRVQAPPNGATPARVVVFFDGAAYEHILQAPAMLDALTTAGAIPPTLAAFVQHGAGRNKELGFNDRFVAFVVDELMPWLRKTYGLDEIEAQHTVVGGLSLGGLCAAYCAYRHPEIFGNVLSQSGSYLFFPGALKKGTSIAPADAETGWLTRQFVTTPTLSLRFYLDVGRFEYAIDWSLLLENRRLRDVLEAKGYPVTYQEFSGGHDFCAWQGTLANGLLALLRA